LLHGPAVILFVKVPKIVPEISSKWCFLLRGQSPRANYTNRATVTFRRS
jgi:hypothetical protein